MNFMLLQDDLSATKIISPSLIPAISFSSWTSFGPKVEAEEAAAKKVAEFFEADVLDSYAKFRKSHDNLKHKIDYFYTPYQVLSNQIAQTKAFKTHMHNKYCQGTTV